MRKELHIWFGQHIPKSGIREGDIIESYDGLANMFRVGKRMAQYNDGKTTTATLYSNGKKAGIGTAVCHSDDKFDVYIGATLALLRLEKSKKKTEMTDWERFVKGGSQYESSEEIHSELSL